jgi:quinol monooxygenase YgiN
MKTTFRCLTSLKYSVFIAAFLMYTVCAYAQEINKMEKNMVAKLTRYEVKPGYQEKLRTALNNYVLHSIVVKSNIMAEAYYEQENNNVIWLIERWINKNELGKVTASVEFKAIETLIKEGLEKPLKILYVEDLEPLTKQQWRKSAKKEDKPFTVMLFVDAKPGTQKTFIDVYNVAMPKFRSEAGVVTYQLSQLHEDSTQFVTYEKFRNDGAFQYHLSFRPIEPVIAYLKTSIKKPPFQSGLHRLIEFAPLIRE